MFYRCRTCETIIPSNTKGVYIPCKCGKIAIDGNAYYTRLIGNSSQAERLDKKPEVKLFRIKQVSTGLYFKGYRFRKNSFTPDGKFYQTKPSLKWVNPRHGECIIVEYTLKN